MDLNGIEGACMIPIVSIIQARMSSSRLPGKVLMPMGGATALDHCIRRAEQFSAQVVVCTSTDASDDPIAEHCEDRETVCIRGPLDDVFWRYRQALADPRVKDTAWFARVTGDCPLVSPSLARMLVAAAESDPSLDYVKTNHAALPRGLAIELVKRSTFEAIERDALDPPEREHVTLHLYETPGRYAVHTVEPLPAMRHPELRLTLDYEEDYQVLSRLLDENPRMTAEEAIERLLAAPDLARLNANCEQRAARPTAEHAG